MCLKKGDNMKEVPDQFFIETLIQDCLNQYQTYRPDYEEQFRIINEFEKRPENLILYERI